MSSFFDNAAAAKASNSLVRLVKMRALMLQFSRELMSLDTELRGIETFIGACYLNDISPGKSSFKGLQAIDPITQTLVALANFMDAAALELHEDWQVDVGKAAHAVPLAALATRLSTPMQERPESLHIAPEIFELFE